MGASGCIIMHEEGVCCILNRPCVVGWKPEAVEQDLEIEDGKRPASAIGCTYFFQKPNTTLASRPPASMRLSILMIEKVPNHGFHYIKMSARTSFFRCPVCPSCLVII